jgi:hypothetical protein
MVKPRSVPLMVASTRPRMWLGGTGEHDCSDPGFEAAEAHAAGGQQPAHQPDCRAEPDEDEYGPDRGRGEGGADDPGPVVVDVAGD